jgi:hypothetical protein
MNSSITLIYTRTDKWILSTESVDWRIWQSLFYWYQASLNFESIEECAAFLKEDFHLTETNKIFIIETVKTKVKKFAEISIIGSNELMITPVSMDFLKSNGELIHWQDWGFVFTKNADQFLLWVYIGGITEQVREIRLSEDEIENWNQRGNNFITELVADLAKKDSPLYEKAIAENRKVL